MFTENQNIEGAENHYCSQTVFWGDCNSPIFSKLFLGIEIHLGYVFLLFKSKIRSMSTVTLFEGG